jgi:hypothetical protein
MLWKSCKAMGKQDLAQSMDWSHTKGEFRFRSHDSKPTQSPPSFTSEVGCKLASFVYSYPVIEQVSETLQSLDVGTGAPLTSPGIPMLFILRASSCNSCSMTLERNALYSEAKDGKPAFLRVAIACSNFWPLFPISLVHLDMSATDSR